MLVCRVYTELTLWFTTSRCDMALIAPLQCRAGINVVETHRNRVKTQSLIVYCSSVETHYRVAIRYCNVQQTVRFHSAACHRGFKKLITILFSYYVSQELGERSGSVMLNKEINYKIMINSNAFVYKRSCGI